MAKVVPKKSSKEAEMDDYDGEVDGVYCIWQEELYRPFLIHSTTYALLTEQILALMPSERNVFLTMNEYDLTEINPMHPNTVDSPTHVIIFCVRFIAGDIFQPIGGLLIYKYKDQSAILAECLKAYINDLWKLGLHVIGTVSPPFESFKGMLHHLVDVKDLSTYTGSLTYSVAPIKEIVHIYDIQFLFIKLQNLFKAGDIKFVELSREYRACWSDISLVLNLSSEFKILSNYLAENKDFSRRVHIFTHQIFEQFLELEAQGVLSKNAEGSAVLLNCIRSFLQFTELDLVDLNLMCKVDGWSSFTDILHTMTFQKSKKTTCTKTRPATVHKIIRPSVRRNLNSQFEEMNISQTLNNVTLYDESWQHLELEQYNKDEKSKTKKGKMKTGKDKVEIKIPIDFPKIKLPTKKPYEKLKPTKKLVTSTENQKTDIGYKTNHNVSNTSDVERNSVGIKLSGKTENLKNSKKLNQTDINCKRNLNCDIDKNNNTDDRRSNSIFNTTSTTLGNKCDNNVKSTSSKTERNKLIKANFDVVINDAEKFFEKFISYNQPSNRWNVSNVAEPISNSLHAATSDKEAPNEDCYDDFCSQTDEETERCVSKICDKVPTIVESLGDEESTQELPEEFERNDVTFELLCTVFGMKALMEKLIKRRVKIAKPDAFVVEHIDFLVTLIKREKNKMNPVYYYGHNYNFLNTELAFSSLHNNTGLFLIKR